MTSHALDCFVRAVFHKIDNLPPWPRPRRAAVQALFPVRVLLAVASATGFRSEGSFERGEVLGSFTVKRNGSIPMFIYKRFKVGSDLNVRGVLSFNGARDRTKRRMRQKERAGEDQRKDYRDTLPIEQGKGFSR